MNRRRIKNTDIMVDKPLCQDVFDADGKLLLKKGIVIETQRQIDTVIARGLYFLNDSSLEEKVQGEQTEDFKGQTPFDLIDHVYSQLSCLCGKEGSKKHFFSRIIDLANTLQQTCRKDANASLGTVFLSSESNYSIMHQIHSALVCEILMEDRGFSSEERLPVLAAALTMNIAMIELQEILFNQKERITENQKIEIQSHPYRGVELLRSYGVTDELWLTIVLQHHEFIDGSGYPHGLCGDAICLPARLLSLADIYCAKLFPRSYRAPLKPDVAVREVFTGCRGPCFDEGMVKILIKKLGIFHPGSFVRLANGEIAVVIGRGAKIHQPIVRSIVKPNGSWYSSPKYRHTALAEFVILDSLFQKDVTARINKLGLWGIDDDKEFLLMRKG